MTEQDLDAAWKFVASYIYYDGYKKNRLTFDEQFAVYCEADGFGKMSREQLLKINDGLMDWSHVRDSSRDAVFNMKAKIEEFLAKK